MTTDGFDRGRGVRWGPAIEFPADAFVALIVKVELARGLADELLGLAAEDVGKALVHPLEHALAQHRDPARRRGENAAHLRRALAQGGLCFELNAQAGELGGIVALAFAGQLGGRLPLPLHMRLQAADEVIDHQHDEAAARGKTREVGDPVFNGPRRREVSTRLRWQNAVDPARSGESNPPAGKSEGDHQHAQAEQHAGQQHAERQKQSNQRSETAVAENEQRDEMEESAEQRDAVVHRRLLPARRMGH